MMKKLEEYGRHVLHHFKLGPKPKGDWNNLILPENLGGAFVVS